MNIFYQNPINLINTKKVIDMIIKLQNILIDDYLNVKVIDFSVSIYKITNCWNKYLYGSRSSHF